MVEQKSLKNVPKQPLRVLLIEDSVDDAELVLREFEKAGYPLVHDRVDCQESLRNALQNKAWDVALADYSMPRLDIYNALSMLRVAQPDLPLIVISGTVGEEIAVEVLKAGAHDYVMKSRLTRLVPAVERELREGRDRLEKRRVEVALKDAESQLQQSQKMEAIGRLAGGIAHDFNNIMAAIGLYGESALDEISDEEKVKACLQQILEAQGRAAQLTRQLLAFSRKQTLDVQPISLPEVVSESKDFLRRLIGEHIQFSVEQEASNEMILADRGQMNQVLMNLVVNARDAMPEGGKLIVRTKTVMLSEQQAKEVGDLRSGTYVVLEVKDTGCGMSDETRMKIYDPFFTTKEIGKGTGLGLSTVYGIVKQTDGQIVCKTEEGKGTLFQVYFPAQKESLATPKAPKREADKTRRGKETVLYVEDEKILRDLVVGILTKHGYDVLWTENGSRAYDLFQKNRDKISLIITDVVMPEMGGMELIQRVRASGGGKIKVLYLSGYSGDSLAKSHLGQADRASHFLEKPFSTKVLLQKIRTILDS